MPEPHARRSRWSVPAVRPDSLYIAALIIVVPFLLTRFLIGASWSQTGASFAIFWGLLLLLGASMGRTMPEKLGWPFLFAMFTSIPGVPITALLVRLSGWVK